MGELRSISVKVPTSRSDVTALAAWVAHMRDGRWMAMSYDPESGKSILVDARSYDSAMGAVRDFLGWDPLEREGAVVSRSYEGDDV